MISRRLAGKLLVAGFVTSKLISGTRSIAATRSFALLEPGNAGYSLYRFGWRPDIPTRSNYQPELFGFTSPPPSVDLRPQMPDVYDQHEIGSCVSNAVAACIQFVRKKSNLPNDFKPSRLFIYYFGREKEKSIASDSGLSISDAIGIVEDKGVPPEADWPYDGTGPDGKGQFLPTSRAIAPPRSSVINEALLHKTTAAFPLPEAPNLTQLKQSLALGYPFIFGFTIYKSFFDNNATPPMPVTRVPVPPPFDQPIGGHAVVAVGYKDDTSVHGGGYFICRNSWGLMDIADREVQDQGHFYMPYAYTQDRQLASDFWTIRASN